MSRVLVISLGVLVLLSLLMTYIVFGQRRSFASTDRIVFEMGDQDLDLYSIQPTSSLGTKLQTLFLPENTFADYYVTGIDCSPDSRSLIFWYIYLYRYDLSSDKLTRLILGNGLSEQSVWSPDGKQIAYLDDVADRQPREVFVINADGSDKTRITNNDLKETSLTWSPDGKQIAFTYVRNDDSSRTGLGVVDARGGATTTLYETTGHVDDAAWSPDGTRIAFEIGSADRTDIYTIQSDGSALTRLTTQHIDNMLPRWSPDGSMISFSARDPGGQYQLYVMGPDGSNPYLVFVGLSGQDVFNQCWLKS